MDQTLVINFKFEIFTDRPCIQEIIRPICSTKIHLMEGTRFCTHQSPFKSLGGDVQGEVGRIHIFHDGSRVPARAVEICRTLPSISPHFQVWTISVKDTGQLIGGDSNCAVHQVCCIGGRNGIHKAGGPRSRGAMNRCSNGSFFCTPTVMLLVVTSQFEVRSTVVFGA